MKFLVGVVVGILIIIWIYVSYPLIHRLIVEKYLEASETISRNINATPSPH